MSELLVPETGRWDIEKAEAMAYLLRTRTDFPEFLQSQQEEIGKLRVKRDSASEKKATRSTIITEAQEVDQRTLPFRLRAVEARADFEEAETEIALIVTREKNIAAADQTADELLSDYARYYDTDPERFAAMTGDELSGHVQAVDYLRNFIGIASIGLRDLRQIEHKNEYYLKKLDERENPYVDWAHIRNARDEFKFTLMMMFGGDSDEVIALMDEYQALESAAYDSYTPKGLVLAFCELNAKWLQFIADSKAAKESELEGLLS